MTAIRPSPRGELLDTSAIALVVSPAPFTPRTEIHVAPSGVPVAALVAFGCRHGTLSLADVDRTRLYIDGEELELRDNLDLIPEPGATVNLTVSVHGSARSFVQLFFQIGSAVVTAIFGPVWGTAVALVGQVVDYVFFGRSSGNDIADANDRGALQDQSNEYRRRSSFPIVAGRQRVGFDVAALPYTQLQGNDVWLHVIFGLHYGPCTLEDVRIGDTLLSDYPAADVVVEEFLTPGPRTISTYPSRVAQENINDQLMFTAGVGEWEVRTAPEGVERIEIDVTFPQGLNWIRDDGKFKEEEVAGRLEYAEEGTSSWAAAPIGAFRDKNNQPLPVGTWYVRERTKEPVRRTFGFEVPDKSKRWKVRVKAWDYDNGAYGSNESTWETYWTALRGIERKKPILDETLAVVAIKIRSSGDLNGTLPLVTGIVEPIVPVWDAAEEEWLDDAADWQPSSNAAAIARWLTTSSCAAKPLTTAEIDASFASAYELIEARDWKGAIDFREEVTLADALAALGRMGRFTCYWNGRALCAVSDWEKPAPRQLFTGKNVEGYSYRRNFQDDPHAIFVEFKNLESDAAGDELIVYADGYTAETAEEFVTLRLDFACTAERAYREARVFLAKVKLQTESHEWTAGIESLVSTYGDRVLVRHATALWGVAEVRVRSRKMAGALVAGVRFSDPVVMEAGKSYAIDIQREDQVIRGVEVVTVAGQVRDITFPAPVAATQAPRPGDLVAFGEIGFVTEDLEIVDITPDGASGASIRAVLYVAEEIEAAETGPIPDLPSLLTPRQVPPVPRLVGTPQGSPDGVIVPFDIDPVRAASIEGFVARWRINVEELEGGVPSWNTLPPLAANERSVRTPSFPQAQHVLGDPDAEITVDIEIRSVLRNGDKSLALSVLAVPVARFVRPPVDFYAEGVVRTSPDGSSFTALAAGCDPVVAGEVQELKVEVAPDDGSGPDPDAWRPLGQPLPAGNPRGDFLDVEAGESYAVRAQWRTADGWSSTYVELSGSARVTIPAGGDVSHDTVNVAGRSAADVLQGIDDLVDIYGDTASAAASAAAAATSASDAIAAEAAAFVAQGAAQTAATNAATQATAAATSASAASGSQSAAATSASSAATQATAAATSAGAALTSQNAAATSATNASTSATTAAGHASSASTSATAAAGSATSAGNSATAAAGSATTASTQATNAGNSATAAAASAVSAASSFTNANLVAAMQLPDRYDGTSAQYFTGQNAGSPSAVTDLPSNTTAAGFGPVRQETIVATLADFASRGVIPATAGRIYKMEGEFQVTAMPGTVDSTGYVVTQLRGLDASFASLGAPAGTYVYATAFTGAAQTVSQMYAVSASTGVTAWQPGSVWLRPYLRATDGNLTSLTIQWRRLTVTDVTELMASAASATAAATSASAASTSATAAGTSASAANTSATNAATSAGAASTSATNASNSATTASGHAANASTSATAAAGSATSAGNSATAAAGSASTASTQATNAGNSATAAAASAVSASSSYDAALATALTLVPDRPSRKVDFSSNGYTITYATPAAVVPMTLGTVTTATNEGEVFQHNGGSVVFATRGWLPVETGRTLQAEIRSAMVTDNVAGASILYVGFSVYTAAGVYLGLHGWTPVDSSWLVADGWRTFTVRATSAALIAAYPTAAYVRTITTVTGSGTSVYQYSTIRLRDVTAIAAADASATAAATSASSAATSATNAGTSASAASTSATNAATSAGAASTSATNASNSATTASGHASTASTAATAAAGSATSAGNSATAAGTSATNAATSATAAGNSATAASASAVSAASSFNAALNAASITVPSTFEQGGRFFRAAYQGAPFNGQGPLENYPSVFSIVTVSGVGPVVQTTGSADISPEAAIPLTPNRRLRMAARYRQPTGVFATATIYNVNLTTAYILGTGYASLTTGGGVTNTWYDLTIEFDSNTLIAGGGVFWRPLFRAGTGVVQQLQFLRAEDITESTTAATSATAAATSASNASTSATAAGTSATAASTSATNAATSAGAASTSATNASNSATTASGHAANASTSATAAAGSATSAGNSATAAAGSATTASTQATNAGNSATAAAASAVTASSAYDAARITAIRQFPDSFASVDYWTNNWTAIDTTAGAISAANLRTVSGVGPVWFSTTNAGFIGPRGVIYQRSGRRYRSTVQMRVVNGGTISGYITNAGMSADGVSPGNSSGVAGPIASPTFTALTSASGWITLQSDYSAFVSGTIFFRPVVYFSVWTAAEVEIRSFLVEDVTDSYSASGSAAAAVVSASSASTSAGAAGTSATAASGSATTASTQAGNAATSASAASSSAAAASTSAASAASSATVAANVGSGAITKNPVFANYPTTPAYPTDWTGSAGGQPVRVSGEVSIYGMQQTGAAGADAYGYTTTPVSSIVQNGYYVIEAAVRLDSGALTGAGVLFRALNVAATVAQDLTVVFATDTANNTRAAIGVGTVGRTYRFAKLVKVTHTTPSNAQLFAMAHWSALGSTAAANQLTWFQCSVRPATDQEIDTQTATTNIASLAASATIASGAISNLQTQVSSAFITLHAAAGGHTAYFDLAASSGGSSIGLAAESIILKTTGGGTLVDVLKLVGTDAYFANKVYFGTGGYLDPVLHALVFDNGTNKTLYGQQFGASSDVMEWFGPSTVANASITRTNGYFAKGTDGQVYYGTAVLTSGGSTPGGGVTASTGFGGVSVSFAGSGWQDVYTITVSGVPLNPNIAVSINPLSVDVFGGGFSTTSPVEFRLIQSVGSAVVCAAAGDNWTEMDANNAIGLSGAGTQTGTVAYKVQARIPTGSLGVSADIQIDFSAYQTL